MHGAALPHFKAGELYKTGGGEAFREHIRFLMPTSPLSTKKMQLKVGKFVKGHLKKLGKKLGERQNGLDHIHPPRTTGSLALPFLGGAFSPPPLTLPVSPRLRSSNTTLSCSPNLQVEQMERSDSAGTSAE